VKSRKAVSLADVAKLAGVDASTASRVLNAEAGHRVRAETRARVLAAAAELNYRPNIIAKGLRTSRTFTLGIIVPQLDNPVFPQIIEGAELRARERGYTLIIAHLGENTHARDALKSLQWINHVDGLLIAALDIDKNTSAMLDRTGAPYIVLNQAAAHVKNYAVLDSFAGAEMAVTHLTELGHQRIAHVAGRRGGYNSLLRLNGYKSALEKAGLRYDQNLIAWGGFSQEGARQAFAQLLSANRAEPPTAVFAATMLSACGAMTAARDQGLRVPEDMSVVGIHDGALAEALSPPLTTVAMPLAAMGRVAADGLIDMIEGQRTQLRVILPPERLVLRGSTAPPRHVLA
jgi:LacI family transcriptional regulator